MVSILTTKCNYPEVIPINIIFADINADMGSLCDFLKEKGIIIGKSNHLRIVTHLDISREDVDYTIKAFKAFFSAKFVQSFDLLFSSDLSRLFIGNKSHKIVNREFLNILGPTNVPDAVLSAMHRPAVDIYETGYGMVLIAGGLGSSEKQEQAIAGYICKSSSIFP